MAFRKFDNLWALPIFLLCCLILNNGVEATHRVYEHLQSLEAKEVQDLHRTGYHFQPPKHWINDPNGPLYYNGIYHLFYQYNPKGAVWGNIVWAHSISKDLINWEKLEPTIFPSKSFDQYGCWSGSATILPDKGPVILYSGIVDKSNTQVQNYVIPANLSDPYLQEWVKPDNNPLITADTNVNKTAFRDPTTAWKGKDGEWRITLGSRHKETGISLLYKSRDFLKWTKVETPLHSVDGTGNWECPDFFPISTKGSKEVDTTVIDGDIKHVMKISLDRTRYDYYTLGKYDTEKDKYVPDEGMVDNAGGLRYDYGNFYASKSFFDPAKSRRILWGWDNESDAVEDDVKKGWAGIQLIPRTIVLDPSGKQLLLWPIEELETLRGKKVELKDKKLEKGDRAEITGITAAQADVKVTFSFGSLDKAEPFDSSWNRQDAQRVCKRLGTHGHGSHGGGLGPFGLITLATENLEELTPVSFRVFKDQGRHVVLLCSDARRSSLYNSTETYRPPFAGFVDVDLSDKKLTLRSLIDHSVVESFAEKGKMCITSRVYPTLATSDNAHLYVFNNGTETVKIETLEAWSMNKPKSMNQ